ncbi:MAG: mersacidin/lichenicidin family type 2 lantibiotic [Rivularia sp. (in: Bacteria)]|nr:mersacidin/lichenicidin family type 2 lantibiotic [Rivularia sp. MS3]
MSNIDVIRAWKDEEYRNSLSEEQLSDLPENPAGMVELSDADMEALAGGYKLGISPVLSSGGDPPDDDDEDRPIVLPIPVGFSPFPGIFNGGYSYWR